MLRLESSELGFGQTSEENVSIVERLAAHVSDAAPAIIAATQASEVGESRKLIAGRHAQFLIDGLRGIWSYAGRPMSITIDRVLSVGGQGAAYRGTWGGRPAVFKVYGFSEVANEEEDEDAITEEDADLAREREINILDVSGRTGMTPLLYGHFGKVVVMEMIQNAITLRQMSSRGLKTRENGQLYIAFLKRMILEYGIDNNDHRSGLNTLFDTETQRFVMIDFGMGRLLPEDPCARLLMLSYALDGTKSMALGVADYMLEHFSDKLGTTRGLVEMIAQRDRAA